MRVGWTGEEVAPGDAVIVRGHPSRDGSHLIHMEWLTLPDGSEVFTEDLRLEQFNDRRRRPE
jgi:phenylpropionate dioxygenase-like ring-hydroxylating dioxygenase large terminal subunit